MMQPEGAQYRGFHTPWTLTVFLISIVIFTFTSCGKIDISGKYNGKIKLKDNDSAPVLNADFMLKQNNKEINGTMTMTDLPTDGQLPLTGTIDGDKIVFNTDYKSGLYLSFVGTYSKNTIKGDAEVTYNRSNGDVKHDKVTLEMVKQ